MNRVNILLDDSFSTSTNKTNAKRISIEEGIICWEENIDSELNTLKENSVQICLAVGMVCTEVVQTCGAGDNVSGKNCNVFNHVKLSLVFFLNSCRNCVTNSKSNKYLN